MTEQATNTKAAKSTRSSRKTAASEIETFKRRFASLNGVMCFMLDFVPQDASAGLELSSFRRASLFREYFGIDTWFLTDCYQPAAIDGCIRQIALGRLSSVRMVNLYDWAQGVQRQDLKRSPVQLTYNRAWQVKNVQGNFDQLILDPAGQPLMYVKRGNDPEHAIEYVNYIKQGKVTRRDSFDRLGFLSRTEYLTPETGFTHTALYYRPNGTTALSETYRPAVPQPGAEVQPRPAVDTIHVMNEQGHTVQRFTYHDELVAWWLLQLLNDPHSFYMCICDQLMDYQRYFVELKRQQQAHPNVRVLGVSHNCHTVDPLDVMNSQLGDNYRFLCDENQRIDRVITLTERQKADVIERYKDKAHDISVIPHHFVPLPVPAQKKDETQGSLPPHSLIHIGRFAPAKDQAQAVDIIKKVLEKVPDATLHFFGSGEQEKEVRDKVATEGLESSVIFHGFVPDLRPVYATASVLLMTSRHEGFPLVLQEALNASLPAVCYDCRYGPAAMIEDGKNGYLVAPNDVDSAASRLITLLSDDKLREKMSKAALKSMQRFTPQKVATLWAKTLLSLLPEEDSAQPDPLLAAAGTTK